MWQLRRTGMIAGRGALDAAPAGGSYTGPGDVVASASVWYGLRGYTAAYSTGSNPAIDIQDQAGAHPLTVNILSDGTLDVASIATWVAANSVSTIKVARLYDQVGVNHADAAALANMPSLVLGPVTGLGVSRPALLFDGTNDRLTSPSFSSVALPHTFSAVAYSTATGVQQSLFTFNGGGSTQLGFRASAANQVFLYAGTVRTATANDATWHALQAVLHSTSDMNVDGTASSTGTAGTNPRSGTITVGATGSATQWLNGYCLEAGSWPVAFSSGDSSSMSSNQHSYWGF